MSQIVGRLIFGVIFWTVIYFLVVGGIVVWPLINIFAYLRVLIFPHSVRKKYGCSVLLLSNESFDREITGEDRIQLKDFEKLIPEIGQKIEQLRNDLSALGNLKRNQDGSISKRSNAGKEGQRLTDTIALLKQEQSTYIINENLILNKPHDAWKKWSKSYGRYLGNRDSIIFMFLGFPIFFFLLKYFNILGLLNANFQNILEVYIYIVFISPASILFDISIFREGAFSVLFSYEYAVSLTNTYDHVFTVKNWVILTLPMPIITWVVYLISYNLHVGRAKTLEPKMLRSSEYRSWKGNI